VNGVTVVERRGNRKTLTADSGDDGALVCRCHHVKPVGVRQIAVHLRDKASPPVHVRVRALVVANAVVMLIDWLAR
jgi:hypothetical protein